MSGNLEEFDAGLLLAFDALLKDQNVTHAAARIKITQSALSARLMRLRRLMNDQLFTPAASGRGMVPTPHALALQPELVRLIQRLDDFRQNSTIVLRCASKLAGSGSLHRLALQAGADGTAGRLNVESEDPEVYYG